jgi:hypothetical protein
MNPKSLLKDELQYKMFIRRISSEVDFQTLPNLFLSVMSDGVPVDLTIGTRWVLKICMEALRGTYVDLQALWKLRSSSL